MGTVTFEERFWANVDRTTPDRCWPWRRSRKADSEYGQVRQGDRVRRAHVVAWELTNGPVPDGLNVLHSCDNPPCCNPAHLFIGTNADNVADREEKGRGNHSAHWRPGHTPMAKLDPERVRRVRALSANGLSQRVVANEVGISQSQVSRILGGKYWAYVE